MGQIWEMASVLVVEKGNRKFTRIATPERKQAVVSDLNESVSVPKFGEDATLVATQTWTGVAAEMRRNLFAAIPRTTLEKAFVESYEKRYPGVQLQALDIKDDTDNNRLTVVMTLKSPKLFVNAGDAWGVRFFPNNMVGLLPMPPAPKRASPFQLPAPGIMKYTFDADFPPDVAMTADPGGRLVRDAAFDWSTRSSFRGNHASASLEVKAFERTVDPDRIDTYAASVRKAYDSTPSYFVATKDSIKSKSTSQADAKAGVPDIQRMLEARLNSQLAKITKTIDAGNLSGDDLIEAYCTRADLLSDLGRIDESIKSAEQAIKLDPSNARATECRGQAFYYKGDYAKAIADFNKSLLASPDSAPEIYYRRGQAKHYAGQMADAAADFEKAVSVGNKSSDENVYPELWHVWSQQKAGLKPADAQVKFAADNAKGEWPRAALAMLHGIITVDQMLATLDNKKGDDKEMALTEAYFYVGQYYLVHGDKARAREYFAKTRERGVIIYGEHVAAEIELAKLGQ